MWVITGRLSLQDVLVMAQMNVDALAQNAVCISQSTLIPISSSQAFRRGDAPSAVETKAA